MQSQGDIKRSRCVKAEFDNDFAATPIGGAVLVEKAMRALGVRRMIGEQLPERAPGVRFSTVEGVYALMAALVVGGRGLEAVECLRQDALACEVFGLAQGAPSSATVYRLMCDLSGLAERCESDWYKPAGRGLEALDMWGEARQRPKTRRMVPDAPEAADAENLAALGAFVAASARRCVKALPKNLLRLGEWYVAFGDATDLEVEGRCFDAAQTGREGAKILRWQTLMLGPLVVAERLMEGNRDEGRAMPELLERARPFVREIAGRARVLALLDAAYFEKQVIDPIAEAGWDFIVCANQQRGALTRLALEQPEWIWTAAGGDARRGWSESQVGCLNHLVEGWSEPTTIVMRRWREEGELDGVWHYSFLATRIDEKRLPAPLLKRAGGYASAIWMLYSTKQARENHYKTSLRDMGLHHPPSGRLGLDQAFYAIASAAANLAMTLRYGAVERAERGIELWRLRQRYFQIAGRLVRSGRTLLVRLSGVATDALRQTRWRTAFAAAGRL